MPSALGIVDTSKSPLFQCPLVGRWRDLPTCLKLWLLGYMATASGFLGGWTWTEDVEVGRVEALPAPHEGMQCLQRNVAKQEVMDVKSWRSITGNKNCVSCFALWLKITMSHHANFGRCLLFLLMLQTSCGFWGEATGRQCAVLIFLTANIHTQDGLHTVDSDILEGVKHENSRL